MAAPGLGPAPPPGSAGSGGPTPRAGGGQAALGAPDTGHQNFLIRTLLWCNADNGIGAWRNEGAPGDAGGGCGAAHHRSGGRFGGVGGGEAGIDLPGVRVGGPLSAATCFREEEACSQPRGGAVLPTAALIKPGVVADEWRRWWWERGEPTVCSAAGPRGRRVRWAPGGRSRLLLVLAD